MSITCRYYKKSDYGKSINLLDVLRIKFSDNKSLIYDRRDSSKNNGNSLKLKIHYVGEKENKYGTLLVLAIDLPLKIIDYEKNGEEKFIIKKSEIVPIQFFKEDKKDYLALICPKEFTQSSVEAINTLLMNRNRKLIDFCTINLNGENIPEEMTRFWVGDLQDHNSKSASVAGTDLKGKNDYQRYVDNLSGIVKAIIKKDNSGEFEYGISREGNIWVKSSNRDNEREKFIYDTLCLLISQGILN